MKIINLQAENIKRLVCVDITPTDNLVQITGRNGQGKSSVLDAVWWALAGAGNIQKSPIRIGETKARIRLDLGEIVVTRTFKTGVDGEVTSSIIVENEQGATFKSPQAMLDSLVGELSFDPLAFARSSTKEQYDTVRKFVPDVDFDAIAQANDTDYKRRTELNRLAKESRAAALQITVDPTAGTEEVDEAALIDELENAGKHNSEIEKRIAARAAAATKIADLKENAARLRVEADRCDETAKALQAKLDAAPALPEPAVLSDIKDRIRAAARANSAVAARRTHRKYIEAAQQYEEQAAALGQAIDRRLDERNERIAAAKLPVPGLSFDDESLSLNGVPFEQASDAEQLRTSIAIGMALNPKLRIIRVRDGSLIDAAGIDQLAEVAAAEDYQIWLERVDSSGRIGFVLEDGHLKETT